MPCMSAVLFSVISCKNARSLRHPTVSGLLSWSGTGPALPVPFQVAVLRNQSLPTETQFGSLKPRPHLILLLSFFCIFFPAN